MDIASISAGLAEGTSPAQKTRNEQIEAEFAEYLHEDTPEEILQKYTRNGVTSYMAEKIEQMKRDTTERVMAAKGYTEEDIARMSPQARLDAINAIMNEVQQQLKFEINEQMKREHGMEIGFDGPAVSPDVMTAILGAQEIPPASENSRT